MAYFYDRRVEKYGKIPEKYWTEGTYITPDGKLFDVRNYSSCAHAGGFVIPFFRSFVFPSKSYIRYYSKEEVLENLIEWEVLLRTKKYDTHLQAQQMRLYLVKYLINVYESRYSIWDYNDEYVDLSYVTGIPNDIEGYIGRDYMLKDVLVQGCNYDSVESQLYRTITTSKFNIYETFYDYILHDYQICQIPKKVYDENLQKYIDYVQPEWMISDKELRLKAELESICKNVPLEERSEYARNKTYVKSIADFLD